MWPEKQAGAMVKSTPALAVWDEGYPPGEPILKLATVRDIFELFSARTFVATSRKWQPNGNSDNGP
ncbi:MAG: hypothetical protein ONB54_02575, partial [candidate division KSB1 bacterium]|nr:hypothetical protein [candidate division KSB1 bacterium]MDZ7297065.1 hypothetical protein [candidate division KSB1 bacterium]MDZ7347932.1 hypothetical protein [candidate division KSB1 bacterium]MDZ7354394.1 hypothetical protein [candidate division KSB1 bacterium]MDZ7381518.1 hypothetical protein [candidate division KSB1 bacterium]